MKQKSESLISSIITDRIGRPDVLLPIIINITLFEDLRKPKKKGDKFAKLVTFKESLIVLINITIATQSVVLCTLLLDRLLFSTVVLLNF